MFRRLILLLSLSLFLAGSKIAGAEEILPDHSTKMKTEKLRFLSLKYGLDFTLNESIGSYNLIAGYGQNLVLPKYSGFFEIHLKIHDISLDWPGNKTKKGYGISSIGLFAELKYGYEFLRHNFFSFGWDTTHGLGFIGAGAAFSNALGAFGKWKWTDSTSILMEAGLSHHNQFRTADHIVKFNNFGPYIHLGLQCRL